MEHVNISVIIPVFNGARTIRACLDSLMTQELHPSEIIVVDNGSTDETRNIVAEYATVNLIHELDPGASRARNAGVMKARGPFVAFIDADCIAEPRWIKRAWAIFSNDEEVDGIVGGASGFNKNSWSILFQRHYDRFVKELERTSKRLQKIDTKNFFIKKSVFWEIGGFDNQVLNSEDVDLGIRLHRAGHRIILDLGVLVYHQNPTSLSLIVEVRREQGLFDYFIFRKMPVHEGLKYFPAFGRLYGRYLFLRSLPPRRYLLSILIFGCDIGLQINTLALFSLRFTGWPWALQKLFNLLMAFAIFQGKLYGRMIETGYLSLDQMGADGKLSRRVL